MAAVAPLSISKGEGEKTATFASEAPLMMLGKAAWAVFPKISIASTLRPRTVATALAPSFAVATGTPTTSMPERRAVAVILSFIATAYGSSGLKSTPTRFALGTTRRMRATRFSCSGSPKPGE
jgi:hypothetical protein